MNGIYPVDDYFNQLHADILPPDQKYTRVRCYFLIYFNKKTAEQ